MTRADLDPELLAIFLEETRAHLRALAGGDGTREARLAAARGIWDAAALVGFGDLQATAREVEAALATGDARATRAAIGQLQLLVHQAEASHDPDSSSADLTLETGRLATGAPPRAAAVPAPAAPHAFPPAAAPASPSPAAPGPAPAPAAPGPAPAPAAPGPAPAPHTFPPAAAPASPSPAATRATPPVAVLPVAVLPVAASASVTSGALGPDSGFDADEARELRAFFLEEAREHLEGITTAILEAQREPARPLPVDELFRKTHTLKGSAATVGLGAVAHAAHALEELFAQVRSGRLARAAIGLEALAAAVDALRAIVEAAEAPDTLGPLTERLHRELARVSGAPGPAAPGPAASSAPLRPERPAAPPPPPADARARPHDDEPLPARRSTDAPGAADASAEERRLVPDRRREDLHALRVEPSRVDELMDGVGELVFDRTRIERRAQELRAGLRDLAKLRLELRGLVAALPGAAASTPALAPIADRLAELETELGGHIAILQRGGASLIDDSEALRRTAASLQDGLTRIRMQPLGQLFRRLGHPLREAARLAGKRVELVTAGEDSEIDKTVVDQIADPLIQILRNAVAHGIEPPAERAARGKPPEGRIRLAARHQGDEVFLEIEDDGAGIDVERLRRVLVESGRLTEVQARAADDGRVIAGIFAAGVSAREQADELAGRGVGLDVVRESIARLGGDITVASTRGAGTRFTIRLPLTTAIAQALLFKVAGQVYALPNVHVVETTLVEASSPALPSHLRVGDLPVPLVSLHRLVGADAPPDARRLPAVVIDFAGRRLAATCDKVIGAREIVVKSLGPLLSPLPLYAGATISGSGKVQLILDPAALVQIAHPHLPAPAASAVLSATDTGSLPVLRAPAPGAVGGGERSLGASRPPRILLADDSRTVRDAVSRMLAAEGYVVDVAVDGAEAWRMLPEVPYDLLVTDLEMPNVDGYQLLERVRRSEGLGRLPVLVISSRVAPAHRARVAALGADDFLPKPVTRPALAEAIARLLASRA